MSILRLKWFQHMSAKGPFARYHYSYYIQGTAGLYTHHLVASGLSGYASYHSPYSQVALGPSH
jgi:hypothetical protein